MKVLIIDDSEMALRIMTRVLTAHGHQVQTLPSPIGATQAILRNRVDVVVIDVNLPSVRGDRVAGLVRANERMNGVGVVLVSGIGREELTRLAKEAGADAVVAKEDVDTELHHAVIKAKSQRRP